MSIFDKKDEKDDFWDLDKLMPKKKSSRLSPFVTKPTITDFTSGDSKPERAGDADDVRRAEERKLTVTPPSATVDKVYYPENTLIKSITVKKYKENYDFYDNFRKAALLYHE